MSSSETEAGGNLAPATPGPPAASENPFAQSLRMAWLMPGLTNQMDVCLRALADRGDELMVVHPESIRDTALEAMRDTDWRSDEYCTFARRHGWQGSPNAAEVTRALAEFRPDAVLSATWARPKGYRAAAKAQPDHVLKVLLMDNIWRGSPRQWLGRLTHRAYIQPIFDVVMVPGDRTEWFARRLGFGAGDVIRGSYAADTPTFDRGPRQGAELAANRGFVFAGRLVTQKAVDVLAAAYRRYRELAEDPWSLNVAGIGPMASELTSIPGVTMHGFLHPPELAELMHESSCLVLPSRAEPFGNIVHEATAAGLPVLVSDTVGAGPGLVQDGSNGWVVPAGESEAWADRFLTMSTIGAARLGAMSAVSHALSLRLNPQLWAQNLHDEVARRLPEGQTKR